MLRPLLKSQFLRRGLTRNKLNNGRCDATRTDLARHFASTDSTKTKEWDLIVGVCLERHPIITKPMNDIEKRYYEYLRMKQSEECLKCDFELQYEKAQANVPTEDENEMANMHYVKELQSTTLDELKKFKLASRVTDDTVTSVKRRLDKNLLLLIEQKFGDDKYWVPPQSHREEGESLRETAERVLKEFCGPNLSATIYGNAPLGFYKYVYPKAIRENQRWGAKIFYYLAKYNSGEVSTPVNYRWLDRQELQETLPVTMQKSISQFLVPE